MHAHADSLAALTIHVVSKQSGAKLFRERGITVYGRNQPKHITDDKKLCMFMLKYVVFLPQKQEEIGAELHVPTGTAIYGKILSDFFQILLTKNQKFDMFDSQRKSLT
jgi:hypothetical protein